MTDGIAGLIGEVKNARIEVDIDADPEGDADDIINASTGEKFDHAIHLSDAAGNPVLTKTGKFRKRAGRPSGGNERPSGINFPEAPPQNNARLAAETAAAIYINTGVVIFGSEWLPNAANMEREQLVEAFNAYFEANGIVDIPPGVALVIACLGYAAPRLYMPKTQTKLQQFILWVKIKIGRAKLNAARADTGTNGLRENNASKANGEAVGWFRRTRSSA